MSTQKIIFKTALLVAANDFSNTQIMRFVSVCGWMDGTTVENMLSKLSGPQTCVRIRQKEKENQSRVTSSRNNESKTKSCRPLHVGFLHPCLLLLLNLIALVVAALATYSTLYT